MSQSFKRGLMILDLFSKEHQVLTLSEIADQLGISSITAYRYVKVLSDLGMVTLDEGNVRISARILRFVNLFREQDRLAEVARDPMSRLSLELNETVALCQLEGSDVVCTYRVESPMALRTSFSIGQRMYIYAGAFARAIAAFLPANQLQTIVHRTPFVPLTDRTIVDHELFMDRLREIRENGYDVSHEEVDPGVAAFAVPIFVDERIAGSLGLALPSVRFNPSTLADVVNRLTHISKQISQRISPTDSVDNSDMYFTF